MSPLPSRPPGDSNRAIHEAAIQRSADDFAAFQQEYLRKLWERTVGNISFWYLGQALSLSASAKTVRVQLDPIAGRGGVPRSRVLECKFGRPSWTEGQIVGKRVRIGYNALLDYGWIIDTVNNE